MVNNAAITDSEVFDKEKIEQIGALAKLNLGTSSEELERNLLLLNATKVDVLDKLINLELSKEWDVFTHLGAELVQALREDIPAPSLSRESVLANAGGYVEAGCVSVPKVMDTGG